VQIADRVLAFSRGHIVAELTREELSVEALTHAVGGLAAPPPREPSEGGRERAAEDRNEGARAGIIGPPEQAISNAHRPRGRSRHPPPHPFDACLLVFASASSLSSRCSASTFTGSQNFRAILRNNTTVALLAMAEMTVIATGNYDLSIAYNVGLMHITAMGLLTDAMMPWPLVVIAHDRHWRPDRLDQRHAVEYPESTRSSRRSVSARSSTASAAGTQTARSSSQRAQAFADLNDAKTPDDTAATYMSPQVAILSWLTLEQYPGRPSALRHRLEPQGRVLTGIKARRIGHGLVCLQRPDRRPGGRAFSRAAAGSQASVGPEFLLPASLALLGATTVRPGRVNARGTIIAVLVLAIGIAGLQQLGNSFFAEPNFPGRGADHFVGLALRGAPAKR